MFPTEFEFSLPKGYIDQAGHLHRQGTMRLATALDEIAPLRDARVRQNEAYLTILVLSRVITQLGSFRPVGPEVIEQLFSTDFAYLEELYQRINSDDSLPEVVICPHCQSEFAMEG